jgi:hypothetical protein
MSGTGPTSKSFGTPFGDEFARGGGLFEHAFEWGGWPGCERLSRRDIAWIGESLLHAAMMRKIW